MQSDSPGNRRWRPIPIIGLTGGIACGKSTVLNQLESQGALCLNADELYRGLVQIGAPLLKDLAAEFGEKTLNADGSLNRAYLASLVFSDKKALEALNRLTHPAILDETISRLEAAVKDGFKWGVFEAAILVEGNSYKEMDYLVVVSAPEETRIARIVARDGLSPEQAKERINAQAPLSTYESKANYVLQNSGDEQQLAAATEELFETLVSRFGEPT